MPRLSTSPRVRSRIRILLKKILERVNLGLTASQYAPETFEYRWIDEETACPKLVLKTKLAYLGELIESESGVPVSKDHVREVLLVLQKKLGILEDNRVKTQGSDVWEFTLKLWHTSTDRNLSKFDQVWAQYKSGKRQNFLATTPQIDASFASFESQNKKPPRHNLTLRPDSHFIDEQSALSDLISTLNKPEDAIVSIVGPGGIGKTTLAI